MPTSYTSQLRLALPATGELSGTWGDVVNNNITTMVEQAISGKATVAMADANQTLTVANGTTDQSRCMMVEATGSLSTDRNVVCPTSTKMYVVNNLTSGGKNIVFKTTAGTGVTVGPGVIAVVYCDGTNVVAVNTPAAAGTLTGTTLAANVVSSSLTSLGTITSLTATTINGFQLAGNVTSTGNPSLNIGSGALTAGAASVTTLTASGTITSSGVPTVGKQGFAGTATTTGYHFGAFTNTSGNLNFGIEGSAGGQLATGTSPYSAVVGTGVAESLHLIANSAVVATVSSTGLAVTGALSASASLAVNVALRSTYSASVGFAGNAGNGVSVQTSTATNGSTAMGFYWSDNALIGQVSLTNSTTTAFVTSSDKRLKTDLGTATDLSVLRNTEIHDFDWTSSGARDRGVFAQDAINVNPRAIVHNETTDWWGADYSKYVPDLIVGWQDHEAKYNALKAAFDSYVAAHP